MNHIQLSDEEQQRHQMAERITYYAKLLFLPNPALGFIIINAYRDEQKNVRLELQPSMMMPEPMLLPTGESVMLPEGEGPDSTDWALSIGLLAGQKYQPVLQSDPLMVKACWALGLDTEPGKRAVLIELELPQLRKHPLQTTEDTPAIIRTYMMA